jgi:hypothetical protein
MELTLHFTALMGIFPAEHLIKGSGTLLAEGVACFR